MFAILASSRPRLLLARHSPDHPPGTVKGRPPVDLDICHLLLLPAGAAPQGALEPAPEPRDAPDFFAVEIEFRSAGGRAIEVAGVRVDVTCQVLDDLVWVADCRYRLDDGLSADAPARKAAIEDELHRQLLVEA